MAIGTQSSPVEMGLDQVFRTHLAAERMAEAEVIALFNPPTDFRDCLQPVNQILLGPKGSGKSIALRWLSFLQERSDHNRPDFYGVVVPIGRYQFDYFRQEYERTGDDRPFLGYLNFYLLDMLLADLQRSCWHEKPAFRLPTSFVRALKAFDPDSPTEVDITDIPLARGLVRDIQAAFAAKIDFGESSPGILSPVCGIQHTISLLAQFADLVKLSHNETRFGLLLDGLDHLGNLGQVLVPLLAKDEPHSEQIITKGACRILPRYLHSESGMRLEEGRDYSIFSCGAYGARDEMQTHLRRILENRLSVYGGADPPSVDSVLPTGSSYSSSGFQSLSELAGGNTLTFLECCAFALRLEQNKTRDPHTQVISPQSQQKAIKHQAEDYLSRDLNDQAGDQAQLVRKYLTGCAASIRKVPPDRRGLTFTIETSDFTKDPSSWRELRDTISTACELRYLQVAPRDFIRIVRREEPILPDTFSLSNLQAVFFDLPIRQNEPIIVTKEDINSAVLGFPHRPAKNQAGLFPDGPYIFVSISGDNWGLTVQKRIRNAVTKIDRNIAGLQDARSMATVTFREVQEKREGKYVDNLLDAIRGANYVVLDVTGGITPGVMVEIGIASGLRKPHALVWLADKPFDSERNLPFDASRLPPEIKLTDIKVREGKSAKPEQFYRWFYRLVDQQNRRSSEMCGFQGSGRKCECSTISRNPNKVYLRVQPRNVILRDKLIEELQRRNIDVIIAKDYQELTSSHSCKALREVGAAIFDISRAGGEDEKGRYSGPSDEVLPLLEVGYAMGSSLNYSCVYNREEGSIHSSMLGERLSSIPADGVDRHVRDFVEHFVKSRLGNK